MERCELNRQRIPNDTPFGLFTKNSMSDFAKRAMSPPETCAKPISNFTRCRTIGVVNADEGDIGTHWLDSPVKNVVEAELRVRSDDDLFENSNSLFFAQSRSDNVVNMLVSEILRTDVGEIPVFTTNLKLAVPNTMTPLWVHVAQGPHIKASNGFQLEYECFSPIAHEIDFNVCDPTRA